MAPGSSLGPSVAVVYPPAFECLKTTIFLCLSMGKKDNKVFRTLTFFFLKSVKEQRSSWLLMLLFFCLPVFSNVLELLQKKY